MKIPCYLTNRDLLTPVRGMVRDLLRCRDVGPITIVDCGSTYEPLLQWYADECPVRVIRERNLGNHAPWQFIPAEVTEPFYFASDADLDLSAVPPDFLTVLADGLRSHPCAIKAGLSLRLDDLPDTPLAARVRDWEARFWTHPAGECWYAADIDTVAAVYRRGTGWGGYGPALRAAPPYTARHLPWYLLEPFPDEYRWYFKHMEPAGLGWSPRIAAQSRPQTSGGA